MFRLVTEVTTALAKRDSGPLFTLKTTDAMSPGVTRSKPRGLATGVYSTTFAACRGGGNHAIGDLLTSESQWGNPDSLNSLATSLNSWSDSLNGVGTRKLAKMGP